VALPFPGGYGVFRRAAIISVAIFFEGVVLLAIGSQCPMTDWAAKYTADRSPDFLSYLPNWLGRHNKAIFTVLLLANEAFVSVDWLRSSEITYAGNIGTLCESTLLTY
jgi:hypothetical protein